MHKITLISFQLIVFLFFNLSLLQAQAPSFSQGELAGIDISIGVTSMMYGPDGRLYAAEYPTGAIKAFTIQRNGVADYEVIAEETLDGIRTMADHNDDGTMHFSDNRQVTGLTVAGTSVNPVIYVSSSDVRIGAGSSGNTGDVGLDTNSGVITRFTRNGGVWEVVDLVRGLPRSEENHSTHGLELTTINGTDYLILACGGFTNAGSPSTNFVYTSEYALSGAVLSIDLDAINSLPILTDNGRNYIYDLPTLDDPSRANVNGIDDADHANYDGVDINDPFGGNDGLNQAIVIPGGPVQVFSPGYRNPYDLVVTQNGALYVSDNGANTGWGGFPVNEGGGSATNAYDPNEPGSQSLSGSEQVDNLDHLELVTNNLQTYTPGSYYGGHPNPTRANPNGAGIYTAPAVIGNAGAVFRTLIYDADGSRGAGYTTDASIALPANWPPVPSANSIEGDWRGPGTANPDGPDNNPLVIWSNNTNGVDEYTASNFGGAMQGDLLAGHSGGNIRRVQLNAAGGLQNLTANFLAGIGGNALGITCNSDTDIFPGSIWAGTLNGKIVVFEPTDAVMCIEPGQPNYDASLDYDGDGYTNQDEEDNGTDPCNAGSQPNDFDKVAGAPLFSDLNDADDDDDGILDADDPFQLGNIVDAGSDAFILPVSNDFFNDQQGLGGIFGLGLTGLMNNGNTDANWLDWIDRIDDSNDPNPNDVLGGASGLMTAHMTSGTALGITNTQEKGYQYGVQVDQSTEVFTVSGGLIGLTGPLRLYGNTEAINGEVGFFIGDGTQSNYIKLVITTSGVTALQEINDIPQTPIDVSLPTSMRPDSAVTFYFVVDPSNGQVDVQFALDGGARNSFGTITAQGSILSAIQETNEDLAVGIIGTSNASGEELEGTWDFLNVNQDSQELELHVNSGGSTLVEGGTLFSNDVSFTNGEAYSNNAALVPLLYQTERNSPTKEFQYAFPLENGDYTVKLHFAEIYWGATGKPAGGIGKRIFDVTLEGALVLDNFDIYAEVGAETPVLKTFQTTVNDGTLEIDFSSLTNVGGVNQPKVSAIEIMPNTGGNEAPVAVLQATPISGDVPLEVTFTGDGSTDDNAVVSYLWNFDDGTTSTEENPIHTFNTQGTYDVTLTVEDIDGLFDTETITINVSTPASGVVILGELKKWHDISLMYTGPQTSENDEVNPFLNYRLNVTFTSPTAKQYVIPGFYAADGNAADSSADSGDKWMVRFSPDEIGNWTYSTSFRTGTEIAISSVETEGTPIAFDASNGTITITASDKILPDNRSKGRLDYVGERYLQYQETGDYFIKAGSDSPENLLAYGDFDNTTASKDWAPHVQDWQPSDPVWQTNKGQGVIGAINYLASKGMNAFSFLTMNVIGDGKDVWPWSANTHNALDGNSTSEINNRLRYDVSKLEQWERVFDHGDSKGMFLHFKTQETENDQLLDGGQLGLQRKLYYRELIARFGHHLALNWNLGEEYDIYNELADPQNLILKENIEYVSNLDAYNHPITVHSYRVGEQTNLFGTLLGPSNELSGPSIQSLIDDIHGDVVRWVQDSENAGKPWVVSNDEQGDSQVGAGTDSDYGGNQGTASDNRAALRHKALWGTLMGGGDGVEYYFGYSTGETDLTAQDFRSRAHKWEDAKVAIDFFQEHVPYFEMNSNDDLVSDNDAYCFAEVGENYLIYLPSYNATTLDLTAVNGTFSLEWFNPIDGGALQQGSIQNISGGALADIGTPPSGSNSDWVILAKKLEVETILINAGGPSLTHNGEAFGADQYFVGGTSYSNTEAQVSELYLTERSSSTFQFAYDIPLSDGDYDVRLYFAEIFWGATGKPAGGIGKRVFDVSIEGSLVLDDYDIYADVGAEVPVIKTFSVSVTDGSLTIDFSSLTSTGGINEPKVSAIEILSAGQFPPIEVDPIVDQNNLVGDDIGSLAVSASGGDTSASFAYEITGQPSGIQIDPSSGLISGTVDSSAFTGGTNSDGVHDVLVTVEKTGSSDVDMSFTWTISDPASCEWTDLADSGPGRFESLSQSIGDKLYITGGWISRIPPLVVTGKMEIYDTNTDTWSLGTAMPIPVTHMGNTVVGDEIWSVGGFAGNDPGVATDAVQIYNTTTDTWSTGPNLPIPTGSGALVLIDNKLHYFGGLAADRLTDIGNHYVLDLANLGAGWATAALMPNPRNHFSGIGLDGIIYAIGGDIGHDGPVQNTKFLHSYDATTDQWTRLADLPFERSHFEPGTTIHNGKIIIVGGRQTNAYFDNVTEYDPQTNTWSELCVLPEKLLAPTAKVFGDRLIVTGGGINGFQVFSNATRWLQLEPIEEPTAAWTDKLESEAYEAQGESGFVQVGNKFYIIGGLDSQNVFSYDYTSDSWSDLGEAPFLFNHFQPVEYEGLIWVLGALRNRNYPSDSPIEFVWVFNPLDNTWIQGPAIPQERQRGAAGVVVYNDKFYVVGGSTNGHDGGYVPWLDEFDPLTGEWRILPDAPRSRDHFYAVQAADKIYAIGGRWTGGTGGFFGPDIPEVDVFDFANETWETLPTAQNLPTPRAGAPVAFFDNKIMIMGGEIDNAIVYGEQLNRVALQITEGFDINTNSWSRLDDTAFPRHGTNAIVSGEGVYLASGYSGWGASPSQENMEFYGVDNPVGLPTNESTLTTQTELVFDFNSVLDISLDVADGDTGIFIQSTNITGPNASSFTIESGELTKSLLKANSSHVLGINFNGAMGETAQLTITYGSNNELIVPLSTGTIVAIEDIAFSQERGFYDTPFDLSISSGIAGATIRYTLDGTEPSQTNGIIYNGVISINTTATVRAIAYSPDEEADLETHSYIFLDDVIQQPENIAGWPNTAYDIGNGDGTSTHDYEMDPVIVNAPEYSGDIKPGLTSIPTMSIVMNQDDFWTVYDGEVGIDGSVEIIYPNDSYPSEYFIAELESHSHLRLKRSMKLDINNSITSNLLKTGPLSGDEATTNFTDTKFVLRSGNTRNWARNFVPGRVAFTRDEWFRASQRAASGIGMPGTFVHLYVNGLYWGLYNPVQRQDAGFMAAYFGGEPDDYMTLNHNGVKSGDPTRFNYLNNTLVGEDMAIQENYEEAKEYIDVENFIDYLIVAWSSRLSDWPDNNFYGGNRNNPTEPFSYYGWDAEVTWYNNSTGESGAWIPGPFKSNRVGDEPIAKLWHSLRQNPEFMQLFVDRVNLQFFNNGPLTDDASRARWATVTEYIETAVIAESARWGDALDNGQRRTRDVDWANEVALVDSIMDGNAERFLDALRAEGYYPALDAVVLNKPGGSVIESFELEMANPNPSGTIYYTTDGSDPQLANGSVSTSAFIYNGPIAIPSTGILEINVRINDGPDWSALTVASYARMELYINEFLASNDTGIRDESGDLEDWIEFYNAGVLPVDLGGMYITDDLADPTQWQIPENTSEQTTIPAGEFLYVWADNNPDEGPLHVNIKLGSGGEEIGLSIDGAAGLETIDSYVFGPQTADVSEGRFADGEDNFVTFTNPTPGAPNEIGFLSGIYINEFIAGNDTGITDEAGELEDWIEIYNSNDSPVDIGGLYITDDLSEPLMFQIPSDNPTATTIPAGGFIILWADDEPLQGPLHVGLKLGKGGEDIGLTQVIGIDEQLIDSLTFGVQSDDISSGRFPDGSSEIRFFSEPTPGTSNIINFVSGLSINEVLTINSNSITDSNGENDSWVEIYNFNNSPIDIGGLYVSNDSGNPALWQIPSTNSALTTIPAGEFITLWADNQTAQGELHLPFNLSNGSGTILISDIIGNDVSTIDAMLYTSQAADVSFGRYPDASEQYKVFNQPTPNDNNILPLITNVYINEFLAGNVATNSDEAGEFDDWIELYNAGTSAVDVGGLFIVDDLEETDPYQIPTTSPSETTIPPGGFLLLWADKQESQGVLHVDIKLSGGGEQIGLLQINGDDTNFIDSLTYLAQTDDISEGRSFDGGPTFVPFTIPTPNASNTQVLSVTNLMLVNALNGEDIISLTDGLSISLSDLPTTSLNVRANATNDVGSVFFDLSGALVKTMTESIEPYALYGDSNGTYNAQTFVLGTYSLSVTPYSAASLGGTQGTPFVITFEIVESSAPIANAGGDQNIMLPTDSIVLDGSNSLDPDGGDIAVYAWTQQSGPVAILSGTSTAQLTASNLEEGDYVFRLTVTDDENETDFDEVTVTVVPEGTDDSIWLEAECATVGSNWTVIDDATASNGQYLQTPSGTHFNAPPSDPAFWVTFEFQATAGPYNVHALAGVNSNADDSFWVRANGGTWIKWNRIAFSSTFVWDQVHDSDNGAEPVIFNLVSGTNTFDISLREDGALLDKLYVTSTTDLPTGLGGNSSNCVFVSEPPVADAGVGQDITLPISDVVLDGSGSNDPDGGAIAVYAWTQQSGPTTANLSGISTVQLIASDLEEGDYTFRLTVTDDEGETDFDEVTVNVMGIEFLPPVANAGGDQNIILPTDSIILDGSNSSDPDGGDIAVYEWTQQSGPTTATLGGATTAQLTTSDLEEGDYVFRLTVTDDENETDFDEVTVTVVPEGTDDNIWLEAECATVGSNWTVIDDATASNGQYLQTPSGTHFNAPPSDPAFWVTFEFQANAGPHNVHALAGVNSNADDSFWVRANGGTWIKWNRIAFSSTFIWDQVHDSDNAAQPVIFNLVSGTNTFDISLREDGALLDKLYVTSTTDLPTGLGGNSSNCVFVSEPPVADAGVDQDITLPISDVVLDGSGSNDPDGGAIAVYAWTQQSGPVAILSGASTEQLTASDLEEGDYVFRLTVIDNEGETDFDEVTVTVAPEVVNSTLWLEDFEDLSNGATSDNGSTAWTSNRPTGTFEVINGIFVTNSPSTVPGIWTSEIIPISGNISISMDVDDGDNKKEANDFVRAYYIVDGGMQVLFGSVSDDISAQTFNASGISGSTIQIVVEAMVSFADEFYYIDNVMVFDGGGSAKSSNGLATVSSIENLTIIREQEANIDDIYIYPNPTNEYIRIRLSTENIMNIGLYDLTGKQVRNFNGSEILYSSDGVQVPIAGIGNGVYMIQMNFENFDTKYLKVVIQN